jgi:23S rRNA (cytosine1962-C5)-methyltransferase
MSDQQPALILKPGREKSLLRRHPWVFSGAIENISGNPEPGEVVDIISSKGEIIARGAYSHESRIISRVWTWNPEKDVNAEFLQARLEQAISARNSLISSENQNAYRLVHAESDGLPGLIVDQYAEVIILQLLSWGVEVWRETITDILIKLTNASSVYERSDVETRALEGLPFRKGLIQGIIVENELEIIENGVLYYVDVKNGHKTGFYLDQRMNRLRLQAYTDNKEVLDCFSYTGGFAMNALVGGAMKVTTLDSSENSLALAERNLQINQFDQSKVEFVPADVFKQIRKYRDQGRQFDVIILDPPKFASTRAQVSKASRGYKDINLLAFKLLRPGGILFTFSCSGGIDGGLFQKIVAGAALDANVEVQIIEKLGQGSDHPIALNFPEGEYLKGLVCLKL